MEEQLFQQAVEDLSIIKQVINETNKSFTGFSRLFISWGVLFTINSVYLLLYLNNFMDIQSVMKTDNFLSYYIPVGVVILVSIFLYFQSNKKRPLKGLEKHLMKMWIFILGVNLIPIKAGLISFNGSKEFSFQSYGIQVDTLALMLFIMAVGLIMTSIFSEYQQPKYLGIFYIGISIIYGYGQFFFPTGIFGASNTFPYAFQIIVLPFTFLYLGFYLRAQKVRGNFLGN